MAAEKITAEKRTEFGKGAARRIRREDKIPAVVYGHGNDPIHLTLPGHDTMMALKHGGSNAVLDLEFDGGNQLALAREVQVDPIRRVIEHIDFVAVRLGEKVTVDVPVHLNGEAAPETLVVTENATVQVEAEATHIPEFIEIDIEGAAIGTQIHASDLVLPEGTTLLIDPETLIVNITQMPVAGGGRGGARRDRGRGRHRARRVRRGEGRGGRGRGRRGRRRGQDRRFGAGLRHGVTPCPSAEGVALGPPPADGRTSAWEDDEHERGLAGRRPGQPRADVRRTPPQRGLPGDRRARHPPGRLLARAQDRSRRRGRGSCRSARHARRRARSWPGHGRT